MANFDVGNTPIFDGVGSKSMPKDVVPHPDVSGGAGVTLAINSSSVTANSVTLTFNDLVIATNQSSLAEDWLVSSTGVLAVTITGILVVDDTITLTTTEQTNGGSYVLNVPFGIVRATDGSPLVPPYTKNFTGIGVAPSTSQIIKLNDARMFDIVFSKPVVTSEALDKSHYSISPSLTIKSITKVQDNRYTIATYEAQVQGQTYSVTVTGIHDTAGNLI